MFSAVPNSYERLKSVLSSQRVSRPQTAFPVSNLKVRFSRKGRRKPEVTPVGKTRVRVINPKNGKRYSVEFMVVKGNCKPLLGSRASKQMHLLSVLKENIVAVEVHRIKKEDYTGVTKGHVMEEFSDVFTGEGI